jgi:hypothetical protein
MSTAFVWKAVQALARGGVIGTIVPASFFDGQNAEPVRKQIAERVVTRLVARLGSHQLFPDALVDAGLYVGHADGNNSSAPIAIWADHRLASSSGALRALRQARNARGGSVFPIDTQHYSLYRDPALGWESNWAPRPYQARKTLLQLEDLPQVQDLFDVKQGARTGLNQAFVLKREEWSDLPEEEQPYFRPAVLNESIREGRIYDSEYVFYPYGEQWIDSEEQLSERVPTYYAQVLAPKKATLLTRARVNPERWWDLTLRRPWQDSRPPKLVSTYFGDRGSFAWDDTGAHVIVQGFGWLPLAKRQRLRLVTSDLGYAYLAILNSRLFSELLAASSNSVAGGQWNLSQKFVRNIPLPILSEDQVRPEVLSTLVEVGRSIHHTGLSSADEAFGADYDEVVRSAYGFRQII